MTDAMKVEEIRAEALEEGRKEGLRESQLLALKQIMKNLGLSAPKAMDVLDIPEASQPEYLALLETENE